MTTILKVEKARRHMTGRNAAGTLMFLIPYEHPLAKMFPPNRDEIFAECSIKGTSVTVRKLTTEAKFLKGVENAKTS